MEITITGHEEPMNFNENHHEMFVPNLSFLMP